LSQTKASGYEPGPDGWYSGQTQHALKLRQHQRAEVMVTDKFTRRDQLDTFGGRDKAGREAGLWLEISQRADPFR
jgi:hypothetical protein